MTPYPHFLRALRSRNFRIYAIGQAVSQLGTWMTSTAALWLAYHLSGDPFVVGLVGFANWIPMLILAPVFGVLVDRGDSLKLVRLTQVLCLLQSGALAVLTFTGHMSVPALIGLCFFQGLVYALDAPARQMLVVGLAGDRDLLDNVIALNSILINGTRLVGPAAAGLIIAGAGPGLCFSLDALSYLAVLASLFAVRIAPPPRREARHPLTEMREGMAYAWAHPEIRPILLLVPLTALVGFSHNILAPIFARDVFGGDARTLGFLMSASALGSLVGGAYLSTRRATFDFRVAIAASAIISAAAYFGIGATRLFPVGLLSYAGAGLGTTVGLVSSNTALQRLVEDGKRGRVMSLYGMGQGFFPIGSILLGLLTSGVGPRAAIAVCGIVLVAGGVGFARAAFGSPAVQEGERPRVS